MNNNYITTENYLNGIIDEDNMSVQDEKSEEYVKEDIFSFKIDKSLYFDNRIQLTKYFSSFIDLLKYCNNKIRTLFQVKNENIHNLRLLNDIISKYKEIIITDELMKDERFSLSEIQDIIDYFCGNQNINTEQIEFIIKILETLIDFLENKMKIIENHGIIKVYDYAYKDEFIKEYNALFIEYSEIFDEQDFLFYEKYYVPKGNYDEAINETFRLLGDS
ncbi:MAG: hypothetical protein LBT66_09200 [Methanobrevibacter sp.]|jgi:hypothetical protein|nr:hypothetical protein [Candidatus Methanovirga meridionalis]